MSPWLDTAANTIRGCRQNLLAQGEGRDLALGEVEEGALAAAARLHHGRDDDTGREQRHDLVGVIHVHARDARFLALVAGERGDARRGVKRAAKRHVHALGSRVALAGDRGEHDARIDLLQCLVTQSRTVEHAAAEVLDDHVAVLRELADHALALGILEVQRQAALVAVGEAELWRAVPPTVVTVHLADDTEGIEIGARFDF